MEDGGGSAQKHAGSSCHNMDRNPSPPSSEDEEEPPGDCIGDTVYSKHWFFSALTRLIDAVKEETEKPEEKGEQGSVEAELEEDLENELCKVWDMSMNEEVALFLVEFKATEILLGVITKSKCHRLTEICVGILGNMACFREPCLNISNNSNLGEILLLLLNEMDPPTLLETSRLLLTCLSRVEVMSTWLERIRETPSVRDNLCFIMSCSTNADLLVKAGELVHKLFDVDEDMMVDWINAETPLTPDSAVEDDEDERPAPPGLIPSLLGAAKQLKCESPEGLEVYMHILQLVTTVEEGVQAIVLSPEDRTQTWEFLFDLTCLDLCQPDDPPLMVQEQTSILSCIVTVMSIIFSSQTEYTEMGRHLPLISSLIRILEKLEACQQKNGGGGLHDGGGEAEESETEEDYHQKHLKGACCEFLSTILSRLTKENISVGLEQGHLTEEKCLCALRNIFPIHPSSVKSFLEVLGEAEPDLAETLRKEIAELSARPAVPQAPGFRCCLQVKGTSPPGGESPHPPPTTA